MKTAEKMKALDLALQELSDALGTNVRFNMQIEHREEMGDIGSLDHSVEEGVVWIDLTKEFKSMANPH